MPTWSAGAGAAAPRQVLRGRVVAPGRVHTDGVLAIEDANIAWVGPAAQWSAVAARSSGRPWPDPEPADGYLLPGLIDVHCHGAAGHGFPDGDAAGAVAAARHHLRHGTTSLVASLVTAPETDLLAALAVCADLVEAGELVGIHLEGPFLAANRCGAQDPAALRSPDPGLLARLLDAGRGHVRSLTYAPELPGAARLAAQAREAGAVSSVGHTDADHATVTRAFADAAGRSSVTHMFNAMPGMHHRAPGPVAAALAAAGRGETVLELVADGVHLADETVAMVFGLVGPGQLALVTDAMAAAGQPDGRYRLGPLAVRVEHGIARLDRHEESGPAPIAGGTARLLDVVRRCVERAGVDLLDAVTAASATPARLLGIDHVTGALRAGLRADVVITSERLEARRVLRAGECVVVAR